MTVFHEPVTLFLSYTHKDEAFLQSLVGHLSTLKRQGLISLWHDRNINAGTEWKREIDAYLNRSQIILLLISADFLASDYCYSIEMQRALQRQRSGEAYVIPILLRPCDWQKAPFGHLQALPTDGKPITTWHDPDAAFADITASIRSTVEALLDGKRSVPPESHDGIYLVRIIDPPCWGRVTKTAIWLAAEGETTYFIDSISIRHQSPLLVHWGIGQVTGPVPPDADYEFVIEAEKTCEYPLIPALVISAHDHSKVVFCTIQLQPPGRGWNSTAPVGILDVVLHYHTDQRDRGRLYLRSPSSFGGDYLARLLKTDIEVEGAIITPKGVQRGNTGCDENQEPILVYKSLRPSFDKFFRSLSESQTWLPGTILVPTLPSERLALNQAIERANALPEILDRLNTGDELAIDLCTGLLLPECTKALERLGLAKSRTTLSQVPTIYREHSPFALFWIMADRIVYALSIRHLLEPSDTLANFILALSEQYHGNQSEFLRFTAQLSFMALSLFRQGNWAKAVMKLSNSVSFQNMPAFHQDNLARWEQLLGTDHPRMAIGFDNLASGYVAQGKYSEAEPLLKRAHLIYEQQLGPSDPYTLRCLGSLATLYYQQSKYAEAELLHVRVLATREQSLGASHPDTGESLNNLASLYAIQGKYAEAEPLFVRALAIGEQQWGPQHRDTAVALNNLAKVYQRQGKYEQAEQMFQRALAINEQHQGAKHPHTAWSLYNLAELYQQQRKYEQAENLYRRALLIREQHVGAEHPDTADSLQALATLYLHWGKYEQVEDLYRRALAVRETRLGPTHPKTQETRKAYAVFLRLLGRDEEVRQLEDGL